MPAKRNHAVQLKARMIFKKIIMLTAMFALYACAADEKQAAYYSSFKPYQPRNAAAGRLPQSEIVNEQRRKGGSTYLPPTSLDGQEDPCD